MPSHILRSASLLLAPLLLILEGISLKMWLISNFFVLSRDYGGTYRRDPLEIFMITIFARNFLNSLFLSSSTRPLDSAAHFSTQLVPAFCWFSYRVVVDVDCDFETRRRIQSIWCHKSCPSIICRIGNILLLGQRQRDRTFYFYCAYCFNQCLWCVLGRLEIVSSLSWLCWNPMVQLAFVLGYEL
ncbi:uncharacterized protein F4807DRAFT_437355, partial [Annulohypoxylon truncatum]|uniref:uncharacterized protein n=1 Tax=Annulohypoxylon truncatum TaxID=327061 RepID=UPI0020073652